ncbi:hypothetical protein CDG77_34925 [Nostoc sp. 'Peltigera membranacea cyanobiont' 213]|nr:hypothetical protein CDG77_34925 [Nostoc sp. 'Peltigera membranacea cyanobiont' 213]
MIRLRYCFKYLLLVIFGLSIVVSQPFLIPAQAINKEAQQQKEADLLTQRGQKQLGATLLGIRCIIKE